MEDSTCCAQAILAQAILAQDWLVDCFLWLSCSSFGASWMESCSRRLVAAVSPVPPSTIRGVAARPAVSSGWASTATATREGDGQSAQPRGCIERTGVRRCRHEDGSRSCIAACQGGTETRPGLHEHASGKPPQWSAKERQFPSRPCLFDWGKISCPCSKKTSFDGCRIVRPTCKMQRRQVVTRWPGCEPQQQVGQHPHRPWCPTQSSDEASFWFTGIVALGLRLHTQALCTGSAGVSKKPGNSCHRSQEVLLLINHGIQVVRACPRPHFWTVRRERRLSWTPPAQRQTVTTDVSGRWCFTVGLTEERRRLMQSGWAPHPMQRTQVGSQFWRSRVRARECGSESRKPPQSRPHSWRLRMFWSTIWHGEIQTSAVTNRASQTRKVWATWWEHHHGESHRDTRAVSNLFEQLAGRIGAIPVGGELPRALRQQRWSPVNVPLIWAAKRVCPSFVFKK